MRLTRLVARGFRNLADVECELPAAGVALLGANGQGKTNLLEAIYYPVLFRSLRGASDAEVIGFGGPGFQVKATVELDDRSTALTTTVSSGARRKRITVDGEEQRRLTDAVGIWMAVAFLPSDVALAGGPATERRHYLDRMLSLADHRYLTSLSRYRAALAQRNSGLRQDRPDLAAMFDRPLATAGAQIVAARLAWLERASSQFAEELSWLGDTTDAELRYHGHADLADPSAWPAALEAAAQRDRSRGMTTVGPHRDDLRLLIAGRAVREFGSTGQQRSAAVALKLIEIATLRQSRGTEPALLLDDVFAELDRNRQERLAERLLSPSRQTVLTAPRRDELPPSLAVPVWTVCRGVIER
ncbi:MAG TPA: DNA replication and repair protein RecF [Gemmatimonadales bacterium]|nr:DNA replication and repair protein RecF [Gemmatimonadales bacterium]